MEESFNKNKKSIIIELINSKNDIEKNINFRKFLSELISHNKTAYIDIINKINDSFLKNRNIDLIFDIIDFIFNYADKSFVEDVIKYTYEYIYYLNTNKGYNLKSKTEQKRLFLIKKWAETNVNNMDSECKFKKMFEKIKGQNIVFPSYEIKTYLNYITEEEINNEKEVLIHRDNINLNKINIKATIINKNLEEEKTFDNIEASNSRIAEGEKNSKIILNNNDIHEINENNIYKNMNNKSTNNIHNNSINNNIDKYNNFNNMNAKNDINSSINIVRNNNNYPNMNINNISNNSKINIQSSFSSNNFNIINNNDIKLINDSEVKNSNNGNEHTHCKNTNLDIGRGFCDNKIIENIDNNGSRSSSLFVSQKIENNNSISPYNLNMKQNNINNNIHNSQIYKSNLSNNNSNLNNINSSQECQNKNKYPIYPFEVKNNNEMNNYNQDFHNNNQYSYNMLNNNNNINTNNFKNFGHRRCPSDNPQNMNNYRQNILDNPAMNNNNYNPYNINYNNSCNNNNYNIYYNFDIYKSNININNSINYNYNNSHFNNNNSIVGNIDLYLKATERKINEINSLVEEGKVSFHNMYTGKLKDRIDELNKELNICYSKIEENKIKNNNYNVDRLNRLKTQILNVLDKYNKRFK